jgi:hypothetical protein
MLLHGQRPCGLFGSAFCSPSLRQIRLRPNEERHFSPELGGREPDRRPLVGEKLGHCGSRLCIGRIETVATEWNSRHPWLSFLDNHCKELMQTGGENSHN